MEVDLVGDLDQPRGEPLDPLQWELPAQLEPQPPGEFPAQALHGLQRDVPHEPIAHHDVGRPAHQVVPLDQPDEWEAAAREERGRLLDEAVPLAGLAPVAEERHGRIGDPAEDPHVGGADDGELEQVARFGVERRAQIDQERLRVHAQDLAADAGAARALEHPDLPDRGEQRRPGAAGAHRGAGPALRRLPHRDRHGGVGAGPQGHQRRRPLGNGAVARDDLCLPRPERVGGHQGGERVRDTHEEDTDLLLPGGGEGSRDDFSGGKIAPHAVHGDPQRMFAPGHQTIVRPPETLNTCPVI